MTENQKTFSGGEPVIRLIGLGETGVKLVETLAMIGPEGVESHSLDTDNRSLSRCHQSKTLLLGQAIPCGLGTGGDVALARAAVESDRDRLAKLVEGANLVFVIAGMGGGTGTGAASLVARLAKESGALVVGVAATPFDCEGTRRCNQATGGLRDLKQASDVVFHFSNQDVVQMTGADTSLNNALEIANRHLCESVLGVSRMLLEPGLLNVSFGDLQSAVQGRQSLGSVIHVEGGGEDRAATAVEKMLAHPVVRGGEALQEASAILVHLSGGEQLSLAEMNTVTEAIKQYASAVDLVVGASGPGRDEALQVTIVIAHQVKLTEVEPDLSAPIESQSSEVANVSFPETFMPSGETSYVGLGEDSGGSRRGGFAYTPPAPTAEAITPELKDSLIEAAARQEPDRKKRKKITQEMLPLEIVSKGRFEKSEPTIHKGEDLDQPTYIRRGMVLN